MGDAQGQMAAQSYYYDSSFNFNKQFNTNKNVQQDGSLYFNGLFYNLLGDVVTSEKKIDEGNGGDIFDDFDVGDFIDKYPSLDEYLLNDNVPVQTSSRNHFYSSVESSPYSSSLSSPASNSSSSPASPHSPSSSEGSPTPLSSCSSLEDLLNELTIPFGSPSPNVSPLSTLEPTSVVPPPHIPTFSSEGVFCGTSAHDDAQPIGTGFTFPQMFCNMPLSNVVPTTKNDDEPMTSACDEALSNSLGDAQTQLPNVNAKDDHSDQLLQMILDASDSEPSTIDSSTPRQISPYPEISETRSPNRFTPYKGRPRTEEQKSRKKEQNRKSATKYRSKKREVQDNKTDELQKLEERNKELKGSVEDLRKQVDFLKNLLLDVVKTSLPKNGLNLESLLGASSIL